MKVQLAMLNGKPTTDTEADELTRWGRSLEQTLLGHHAKNARLKTGTLEVKQEEATSKYSP